MVKTLVVTGAAGALGSAVVRHLAAEGHKVVALDAPRTKERLSALEQEKRGHCFGQTMDVASALEWIEVMARIEKELGPPDGAVLIAGGWQGGAPFHAEVDDSVWRAMMSTNLDTVERSLRALLPGMVARRKGSVVVIGSRAVERPWTSTGAAAYAASKAALVALSQVVAAEVIDHGVRVNAVLPSVLDTAVNREGMPGADTSRWVSPDSLAGVIAFLLSDGARDVSGAAIPVYGRV
jgi:NAD(P)-dependent dehydrogenase (short-subunit alcohol dehydrogenase family)